MSGARAVIAIAGALIAGCTNARLAHGPIALGPTPTEVELAQPLTSWEHSNKSLTANIEVRSLKDFPIPRGNLVGKYQDDRAIYFLDGRRIQVRATLVLEAGEVIEIDGSTSGCYDVKRYCACRFTKST
jgi:hypothetical protein